MIVVFREFLVVGPSMVGGGVGINDERTGKSQGMFYLDQSVVNPDHLKLNKQGPIPK